MKKTLFLLFIMLCTIGMQAQMPLSLIEKTWMDQEQKMVFGHVITKIFGEYPERAATYQFAPLTSIAYKNLDQLLHETDSLAQAENWPQEKLLSEREELKKSAPGGRLLIYITRYTEDRANFKWYFVIIRNEKEKEITEMNLPYQAPQMPEGRGWWNFINVDIDQPVGQEFYVYLNDRQSQYLTDFKFKVEQP